MTPNLLDLTQWSTANAVSRNTAIRWAQRGRLKGAMKLTGTWIVPASTKPPTNIPRGNPAIADLRRETLEKKAETVGETVVEAKPKKKRPARRRRRADHVEGDIEERSQATDIPDEE